jgi:hypothetical protein
MDIYENYDTTHMTPDEIMKLFKQAEWNEIKPVKKIKSPKSFTVFSNNNFIVQSPVKKIDSSAKKEELVIFSTSDIKVESPNKKKNNISKKEKKLENNSNNKIIKLINNEKSEFTNKTISRPLNNIEKIKQKYCFDLHEYENQQKKTTDWDMWSTPNFSNFIK